MDGFINLLKPPGMTSSDAVLAVRRLLPKKTAVGHGGTLDPDAAGVLPVCVGKATRLFDYIIDKRKVYIGELCLGIITDTCDLSGKVLEERPVSLTCQEIKTVFNEFIGDIMQIPPAFSALKKGGVPLYVLARKGESPELEPRSVHIDAIEYLEQTAPCRHLIKISCGKGVYIRSLMRDIGDRLGTGGCMSFLLRAEAGAFNVNEAVTIDELKAMSVESALKPMDTLLMAYPRIDVKPSCAKRVLNGMPLESEMLLNTVSTGQIVRLYLNDKFAGMGAAQDDGRVIFRAMLFTV